MNSRSRTAFDILKFALVIGLLGDVLLRATPWGLNVFLFNLVFVAAFAALLWRSAPERLTGQAVGLMAAQLFFAAMFVWRDSIELRVADTIAIIAIISIQLLPRLAVTQRVAGMFHYGLGFLWSSLSAFFAPAALLMNDVEWSNLPKSGWRKHMAAALRGLAIATPLVLIFGGLFVAADAAYQGMVQRVFNIDPTVIFSHAALIAVFGWLSMGYLRGAIINPLGSAMNEESHSEVVSTNLTPETRFRDVAAESGEPPVMLPQNRFVVDHLNISDPLNIETANETNDKAPASDSGSAGPRNAWTWQDLNNSILPQAFTLGTTEVAVILGAMNLLFLSFVIVQIPYLFGGLELVQNTPDFKLAEYARRGFGELVTVSALVLPTLLVGQWLIRRGAARAQMLFKVMAGTQIVLLFVIMASAVQRLLILTGSLGYGLTTVRLYPLIFMSWLAVVFVWFGATVLRGSRQHFAWGALWSAFFFLGATHVMNPDAFIVRTNLNLYQAGRPFDSFYNSELSADAVPALVEAMHQLPTYQRCEVGSGIHYQYRQLGQETDLRSWNYSRRTAWRSLHENDAFLHQTVECPPQFSNDMAHGGG